MTINHVLSWLSRPILPGFNTVIHQTVFGTAGWFPEVRDGNTAFSRTLDRHAPTGYCPEVFVETSGQRVADRGLAGTFTHHGRLGLDHVQRRS